MRSATLSWLSLGAAVLGAQGCGSTKSGATSNDGGVDVNPPPINGEAGPDAMLPESGTMDMGVSDTSVDSSYPCTPIVSDDASGVFVAQNGTDGGSCGTRLAPCKTIGYGIMQTSALSNKTTVYVAAGVYAEALTLANGVGVIGGWNASGSTWQYSCNSALVTVNDTTNTSAVTATGLTSPTTLSNLTITNALSAGSGVSLYGIFSTNSMLVLTHVVVGVGPGGPGSPGATAGTGGGTVASPCTAGDSAPGTTPGAAGTAGTGASYSASGVASGGVGGTGGTGQSGDNGSAGGAGACDGCTLTCEKSSISNACLSTTGTCCGDPGSNGCAATAGTGGSGGSGGGSSIALFVWAGAATVTGGALTAGNGGAGGGGASGGSPGAATLGAVGTPTHFANGCPPDAPCTAEDGGVAGGGAAGGNGGTAAGGGGGGGGAGGDSYAYYAGGGATVTVSGTMLTAGTAGSPGPAGAGGLAANGGIAGSPGSAGPAGTAALHN
jgi:hypothetical protein